MRLTLCPARGHRILEVLLNGPQPPPPARQADAIGSGTRDRPQIPTQLQHHPPRMSAMERMAEEHGVGLPEIYRPGSASAYPPQQQQQQQQPPPAQYHTPTAASTARSRQTPQAHSSPYTTPTTRRPASAHQVGTKSTKRVAFGRSIPGSDGGGAARRGNATNHATSEPRVPKSLAQARAQSIQQASPRPGSGRKSSNVVAGQPRAPRPASVGNRRGGGRGRGWQGEADYDRQTRRPHESQRPQTANSVRNRQAKEEARSLQQKLSELTAQVPP